VCDAEFGNGATTSAAPLGISGQKKSKHVASSVFSRTVGSKSHVVRVQVFYMAAADLDASKVLSDVCLLLQTENLGLSSTKFLPAPVFEQRHEVSHVFLFLFIVDGPVQAWAVSI
jgi:hypothetical protein